MSPSRILALSSSAFVVGIALASFFETVERYLPALFILSLCLAVSFGLRPSLFPIIIFLLFSTLGSLWLPLFDIQKAEELSHFQGVVIEQPDIREKNARFVLSGGVLLITERHAGYQYGDILDVRGKIAPPEPFDGFDYPGFLAKDGIRLVAYYPEVEIIGYREMFWSFLISFRERAVANLRSFLSEPHASIAAAMLIGEQRGISSNWQEKLSATGVGHAVSVSGLHVTVAAAIATALFTGLGRRKAAFFVLAVIFLFVLMTGMQAPAIRAGIMGSSLVFASLLGRMSSPFRNLMFAASIMLFLNPLLLEHDIGFQLSFLAMVGIIHLSFPIGKRLSFLPLVARDVTAMSLAAYSFTLPVIIYHFGQISLVFIITNLLIVPTLYTVMIFGLAFIFLSFVSAPLASVAAIPLWILFSYFIGVVNFFSSLPWASVAVGSIGPVLAAAFYLFLLTRKKSLDVMELEDENISSEGVFEMDRTRAKYLF